MSSLHFRKLKQAFTVDWFDDIVLFVSPLAPAASWCGSDVPNRNVLMKLTKNSKYPQCKQETRGSNTQHEGLQSQKIVYQQRNSQ